MITRKTVFVLGAGASKPYGFPTGGELRDIALQRMRWEVGGRWTKHLSELGFKQPKVAAFVEAFRESPQSSLDLFVEHRPTDVRLAKAAIALALIPCENPDSVFPQPTQESADFLGDNWYRHIWEKMATVPFDEFGENQVSFVTFNYDRSLEHFFRTGLKNAYEKTLAEADAVLKDIPIVHVHGRLGALDAKTGRRFSPERSRENLEIAMNGIVIMSNATHDSEAFQKAREELAAAEQIFFLGFHYHQSNMNRLQVLDYASKVRGGTSLGLGLTECRDIAAQWQVPMAFAEPPWPEGMNTLNFLKNAVSFR